jgi:cell division inhibitor SepF
MAERLKRAAAWLGLVTDDRYAEYDDADSQELTEGLSREELIGSKAAQQPAGTPTGPEKAASVTPLEPRRTAASAAATPTPPASHPRMADVSRIITVHPRTYNEARTIGEHFRDGVPVIMNLSEMEDVDAKRLVDFAAGLIFGLRGTIERVTTKVFLLSPHNVTVAAEDRERIAAGGFFNQS